MGADIAADVVANTIAAANATFDFDDIVISPYLCRQIEGAAVGRFSGYSPRLAFWQRGEQCPVAGFSGLIKINWCMIRQQICAPWNPLRKSSGFFVGIGSATDIGTGVAETEMNATLFKTDLATRLKIVTVGLMGATLFTWAAILAHWKVNGM